MAGPSCNCQLILYYVSGMQFKSSISNILPKEKYIKKRDSPDLERDV